MGLLARIADGGRNLWKFFRDVRSELRRVIWPTRRQTMVYTLVVLVTVLAITVLLHVVDTSISYVLERLLNV